MAKKSESILGALGRSLNPGMLSGITFSAWCSLLWKKRFRIHPAYLPRALSITASSMANSIAGAWEQYRYEDQWLDLEPEPPIIVIGIARSGTTFLHNLFATNPLLAYPSVVEARYPLSFVTLGAPVSALTRWLLGGRRVQDGVGFGPDTPAEEISALRALGVNWPMLVDHFSEGGEQPFDGDPTRNMIEQEQQVFIDAFRWFSQKLTWRHNKRLVFKNPGYLDRLPMLLRAVPDAKIVFIHRHPYEAINSGIHAYERVLSYRRLRKQNPVPPEVSVRGAGRGIRAYLRDRERIPEGNRFEVAYADVVSDPVGAMTKLYRDLAIPGLDQGLPALEAYVAQLNAYRKNRHPELPAHLRKMVREESPDWFNAWGYCEYTTRTGSGMEMDP